MLFKTLVILVQLLVFSAVAKADSLGNTKVISVGKDIYNTTLANKFWSNIKFSKSFLANIYYLIFVFVSIW